MLLDGRQGKQHQLVLCPLWSQQRAFLPIKHANMGGRRHLSQFVLHQKCYVFAKGIYNEEIQPNISCLGSSIWDFICKQKEDRQVAPVTDFHSNLTTESNSNKEFGLPRKSEQVLTNQLLTVHLPLRITPTTCTIKLTSTKITEPFYCWSQRHFSM